MPPAGQGGNKPPKVPQRSSPAAPPLWSPTASHRVPPSHRRNAAAHGPRRDPRAGAPSAFAPRTARCPLAADPGCNLPGQRSFLARWQMVAKPARRRSPRRHQQRRRRRSSSHSASRAVRLPHAAPIDPVHCTSGATMCTCSSMPMPRVPCADADRVECTAAGRARLGPSRPDGAARRPQADGSWPMPAVSWPFGLGHSSWRRAEQPPPAAASRRLRQRLDGASGRARRVRAGSASAAGLGAECRRGRPCWPCWPCWHVPAPTTPAPS